MRKGLSLWMAVLTICLWGIAAGGQDSEIVVKIGNDEVLTASDLKVRPDKKMTGLTDEIGIVQESPEDKKRGLDTAVNMTLLAMEAKKTDLMKNAVLKARIRYLVDSAIVKEYVENYIDSLVTVSEEEMAAVYKTNPKYRAKEILRARHILVKKEEEANEILKEVRSGKDFSKLARERSQDDTTREAGGDLGWFERGKMIKPFEEAVFALKEGEVSDVVKTGYGFHIIKLESRKTAPRMEFEKARGEIFRELKSQKKKEFVEKKLKELRASVPIEILSDKYKN